MKILAKDHMPRSYLKFSIFAFVLLGTYMQALKAQEATTSEGNWFKSLNSRLSFIYYRTYINQTPEGARTGRVSPLTDTIEGRLDLEGHSSNFSYLLKPRLKFVEQRFDPAFGGILSQTTGRLNEWRLRSKIGDDGRFFGSIGREVLQWGPSAFFSPTNPFYLTNSRTSPLLELQGIDNVSFTWLPNDSLKATLGHALGPKDPGTSLPIHGPMKWLKTDFNIKDASVSAVINQSKSSCCDGALFGQITITDALLAYAEFGRKSDASSIYPTQVTPSKTIYSSTSESFNTALLGASYTMEDGSALSLEGFYNGGGLSTTAAKTYFDTVARIGLSQVPLDLGLRSFRRRYVALQYIAATNSKYESAFRVLSNLDDHSKQVSWSYTHNLSDRTQLGSIVSVNHGEFPSEFGRSIRYSVSLIGRLYF